MRHKVRSPHHLFALYALAALAAPLAAPAGAQGLIYTWPIEPGTNRAAAPGDLDGDGVGDMAIGTPWAGSGQPGRLRVWSAATGAELWVVEGQTGEQLGSALAGIGDIDGDGRADLAVGALAPSFLVTSYVRAVSGSDGATLWQRNSAASDVDLGAALARLGDLDHDGLAELAVSNSAVGGSHVLVLSGADGAPLFQIDPPVGGSDSFGRALASAGDLDGNGADDLAVGDPFARGGSGRVTVHSGIGGALLASFDGPPEFGDFGAALAGVGDVSGDGVPDLLVGSPAEILQPQVSWGRARLLSGATGATLMLLEGGLNRTSHGNGVARYPDADGDGFDDLAVSTGAWHIGCCTYFIGDLRVHSSQSGALLYTGTGHAHEHFAVLPDLTGDGLAEFLLPGGGYALPGFVAALSAPGLAPPTPWFGVFGCPSATSSQGCEPWLVAQALPAGAAGVLAWSTQRAPSALSGPNLCLAGTVLRTPVQQASVDGPLCAASGSATGTLSWTFPDAELSALGIAPGETFYMQVWHRDPAHPSGTGSGLSNGIELTLWP